VLDGGSGVASFITIDEQFKKNEAAIFPVHVTLLEVISLFMD